MTESAVNSFAAGGLTRWTVNSLGERVGQVASQLAARESTGIFITSDVIGGGDGAAAAVTEG